MVILYACPAGEKNRAESFFDCGSIECKNKKAGRGEASPYSFIF
jgi:hypothetical protein